MNMPMPSPAGAPAPARPAAPASPEPMAPGAMANPEFKKILCERLALLGPDEADVLDRFLTPEVEAILAKVLPELTEFVQEAQASNVAASPQAPTPPVSAPGGLAQQRLGG